MADTHPGAGRTTAVFQVIAAATLWGVSGVVARALFNRSVEPAHLVQVRMTLGGLALLPLAFRRGPWLPRASLPYAALYALALAAVQLTYFQAIAFAGVAVAVFLQYTSPLLVAAWEAARERRLPPRPVLLALLAAICGSALLVLPGGTLRIPLEGFLWGAASSVAMAVDTVFAGAAQRRGARAIPMLAWSLLLGALLFVPYRLPWTALAAIPGRDWPFFVYIAILATAVPFGLYAAALGRLRGSVVMLIAMLEPVLGAALAWVALGEALSGAQLAGGALILGGIALAVVGARRE
ncbi:MAG: EamA family transporter [Deltaproteobacteria bacterium]|nr:EamA family transporter [Deltaproteobacteria bacterium]